MCTPTERSITAENKNKGREMETQLQKSLDEPDELLEAQAEVRHLRETTLILREELEAQRYEKDAAVQGAVQRSSDEIIQLKNTATSLRDELESLRFEKGCGGPAPRPASGTSSKASGLKNPTRGPASDPALGRNPAAQEHRDQPPGRAREPQV